MPTDIRPSALAGSWYPAGPQDLRNSVAGHLRNTDDSAVPRGRPVVVVAPHAGYIWSGDVAGGSLGHLATWSYERIVLLAPNHRRPLRSASCPIADAYATPLGDVALDTAGRDALLRSGVIISDPDAHIQEHAEEIQLPFLQLLWDDVPPVLPLLIPRLSEKERNSLAEALGRWCDGRTLFLVSTDFTHYGADFGYIPFVDDIPHRLEVLDMGAVSQITSWDAVGLRRYAAETGITMCGLEAMALVMMLPWPTAPTMILTGYRRSGDREGDHSHSVSYVGMIGTLANEVAS